MFGVSLMDLGTLPSYEESCDPAEDAGRGTMLTRGTTIVMESYQSTCPSQGKAPVANQESSVGGDNDAALLDGDGDNKGITSALLLVAWTKLSSMDYFRIYGLL